MAVGTMDFFEHQNVARRKTAVLIIYYIIAVILIATAVYLAFALTFLGIDGKKSHGQGQEFKAEQLWNSELFIWVIGGTLLVVVGGSLYKISQLSGGGAAVAEMLGGRPVNANTSDPDERKVLNVVEEMAIASGTSVPKVFVLEQEPGINAFAAGFSPSNSVIAVTKGCIQQLSRDELQGVIAHEFSHILNGDMRLNIKLMGVLHGILIIGMIGYWIFRISLHSGSSSRSRNNKDGNRMPLVLLGLIVMVVGYVGVLFGKLIKSAVSRQREYLADAAAVQFTRNPNGIAGALKKIGGIEFGSKLRSSSAEDASHLFFANGLSSFFMSMMATHPPLPERIRRIDPSFEGNIDRITSASTAASTDNISGFTGGGVAQKTFGLQSEQFSASVGAPRREHLEYASKIIAGLPESIISAAREPFGARAVVYTLLLNKDAGSLEVQLKHLAENADEAVYAETVKMIKILEGIGRESSLPLIDLSLSTLKELSALQYEIFRNNVQKLVEADNEIDLFEMTLQRMILRRLDPVFRKVKPVPIVYYDISPLLGYCADVISCLAYWGTDDQAVSRMAFEKGSEKLGVGKLDMKSVNDCGLDLLLNSLDQLTGTSPAIKKRLIEACAVSIAVDGKVTLEEAEILRCIGDTLDCPIPLFLPGQVL